MQMYLKSLQAGRPAKLGHLTAFGSCVQFGVFL